MISPHSKIKRRIGLLDLVILALVFGLGAFVYYRVGSVLEYNWNFSFLPEYFIRKDEDGSWVANILLLGVLTTIRLAIWSMLFAAIFGTILGIMRTSTRLLPRMFSRAYVELIRNIPPLVFFFIFYFFISSQMMPALGISDFAREMSPTSEKWIGFLFGQPELLENIISGIVCLAFFEAAYIAEIVRAGIEAVPKNQYEAGLSVGLSRFQLLKSVVLPQAYQKVLPPLANQFITLIKDSSIVSLISIQELTFIGQEVAVSTSKFFETWIFVAVLYFVICYSLALLFGFLERKSTASQR